MLQPLTVPGPNGKPGVPAARLVEEVLEIEVGPKKFKLSMAEKNVLALQVVQNRAALNPVVSFNHHPLSKTSQWGFIAYSCTNVVILFSYDKSF